MSTDSSLGLSRPPYQIRHSSEMCLHLPLLTQVCYAPYTSQCTHHAGATLASCRTCGTCNSTHATSGSSILWQPEYRVPYSHAVHAPACARWTCHLMRTMPTSSCTMSLRIHAPHTPYSLSHCTGHQLKHCMPTMSHAVHPPARHTCVNSWSAYPLHA